jgi:hypothetical protein
VRTIQQGHEAIFLNFKSSPELQKIFDEVFLGKTCDHLSGYSKGAQILMDHLECSKLYSGIVNKNFGLALSKHLDNLFDIRELFIYYLNDKNATYRGEVECNEGQDPALRGWRMTRCAAAEKKYREFCKIFNKFVSED